MIRLSLALSLLFGAFSLFGQPVVYRTPVSNADISSLQTQGVSVVGLKGSHSVSHSGSAVYSVPLDLIPGIGDMMPNISLVYNSSGSNGHLGTGWSMSGLSAISITSRELIFDDEIAAADVSTNTRYSLNGQRLVAVNGNYGANGTIYVTESHDFSTIESVGSAQGCVGCPDYFIMRDGDGVTTEYGRTANSKVIHTNGGIISYYLERVQDNNGNFITYTYADANGEKVLSEIAYTGNVTRGISPHNRVRFSYSLRKDLNRHYAGGVNSTSQTVLRNNLLTAIEIVSGTGVVVKRYDLKYAFNEYESQLAEITLTGAAGETTNSMLFKYGEESNQVSAAVVNHNIFLPGERAEIFNGDFNGDGRSDIFAMYYTYALPDPVPPFTVLGNESGLNGSDSVRRYSQYRIFLNNGNGGFNLNCSGSLPNAQNLGWLHFKPYIFDFTGKGRDEIILAHQYLQYQGASLQFHSFMKIGGNCEVLESSPPQFSYSLLSNQYALMTDNSVFVGDFTGNGFQEVLTHFYRGSMVENNSDSKVFLRTFPSLQYPTEIELEAPATRQLSSYFRLAKEGFVLDFDGDGKDEIALLNDNRMWMISFRIINGEIKARLLFEYTFPEAELSDVYVGDFNGDGRFDFLMRSTLEHWSIYYSRGLTNQAEKFEVAEVLIDEPYKTITGEQNKIFVTDIDNNGMDDIVVQYPIANPPFNITPASNVVVYYNTGTVLELVGGRFRNQGFQKKSYPVLNNFYRLNATGDFNGDGQPDFIAIVDPVGLPNQVFINYRIEPDRKTRLLTAIRDSYGNITKFEYSNLAKGAAIYEPSTQNVPFPLLQKALSFNVVSKLLESNQEGFDEYRYRYQGLIFNKYRNQTMGFSHTYEDDIQTGYTTKTSYQLYHFGIFDYKANVPVAQEMYKSNQNPAGLVSSTHSSYTLMPVTHNGLNNQKAFWLRQDEIVSRDFIQQSSSRKTWSNYNVNSGLPATTQTFVYRNTQASGSALEQSTTQTTYTLTGSPAIMFLPTQVIHTNTRFGETAAQTTQTFQYDALGRLLTSSVRAGTPMQVSTTYTYDQFGNITRESVAATNQLTRITDFTYDASGRFLVRQLVNNPDFSGQIEFQNYNQLWGKPQRIIDVNGQRTDIVYDNNWGYTTQVTDPFQNTSTYNIEWTTQHQALTRVQISKPGISPVTSYFDKLGRLLRTETIGFNNQLNIESYTYNTRGNVVTKTVTGANGTLITSTYTYNYDLPVSRLTQIADILGATSFQY